MDALISAAILAVLLVPLAIIVLLIGFSNLRGRVRQLESDIATLRGAQPAPARSQPGPWSTAAQSHPEQPPELAPELAPEIAPEPPQRPEFTPKPKPTSEPEGPIVIRADRLAQLMRFLRENWVYVISAVSLALAGIFFVQYGIEKGLLPPLARVLFALALGAALVTAGEWIRRHNGDTSGATAQLPSTFSGAGIVSMFAGILAARQMYDLIGTETALIGLVAVAGLAIVLGWFHGPFLAAVGLIGATASPFVVGGEAQDPFWLYGYFTLVTFAGLAVDTMRRWAWVSVLALALGLAGAFMLYQGTGGPAWFGLMLVAVTLIAMAVPVRSLTPNHEGQGVLKTLARRGKSGWPTFPVRLAAGTMTAATVGLVLLPAGTATESMTMLSCLTALVLAVALWGARAPAIADLAVLPAAGFLIRLAMEGAQFGPLAQDFAANAIALRPPETSAPLTMTLLLGLAIAISLAAAHRSLKGQDYPAPWAAGAALAAPVAAVILEIFWTPTPVTGPYLWALHAIALAALMVGLAAAFARQDGQNRRRAAYATLSALSLIALALFIILTEAALTLALGVLIVTAALLDRRFRLPEMSLFIQAGVITLGWRLIVDPGLEWAFDAPLWEMSAAFSGALAAMAASMAILRGLKRRTARVFLESGLSGYCAIFANVLILRWIDSQIGMDPLSHWAVSLNAMPWLVVMLVQLYRLRLGGRMRWVRGTLATIAGLIGGTGLAAAVLPLNPLFYGKVSGPLVFDTLLLAYALPGLLLLAARPRLGHLPRFLRKVLLVAGAALLVLYAGLEIRHFWHGDILSRPRVTQPELYSYTLAMMLTGAALLYQAIARRSHGLRRVAMAVIGLTVAKVFLIDASGLSGLTRVFSFLLLGLSLAGLAWLNRWAAGRWDDVPPENPAKQP